MEKREVLSRLEFGRRVAEEEVDELSRYFVETDYWKRLFGGGVDIVYGPKGSGKSALYVLLHAKRDELFDRGVLLVAGENPRGAPAFRDLTTDPPATEREFVYLWKLYVLCLILDHFEQYGLSGPRCERIAAALESEGLRRRGRSLSAMLRAVSDYVRRIASPAAVEAGLVLDSVTGAVAGVTGNITFSEPSATELVAGRVSVDQLLEETEAVLHEHGFQLWLLLDRLDVAFAETPELEENALRALFRVYLDFLRFDRLGLKIFLRSDVWHRIARKGFREASHVTRSVTIEWDARSLMHLIVSRALSNDAVQEAYGVTDDTLTSVEAQRGLFYRMCPLQVDVGPNKPLCFDWVLGRTRDGKGVSAPREVIHFFNALRDRQLRRAELGEALPDGDELFARPAFKEALEEVSKARLEQTLYTEYPSLRQRLEMLRAEKTLQNVASLARNWRVSESDALEIAAELVEMGFFEKRGTKDRPLYWVPFLYRDSLDFVQGSAPEVLEPSGNGMHQSGDDDDDDA